MDTRPRWTSNRINNTAGNVVTSAYVLKNEGIGKSWIASGALTKSFFHGLTAKTAYSYGESKNTVDAGSTAGGTFNGIAHATTPDFRFIA